MSKIYKLKVKKSQAGRIIPFPLLYVFPASLLPQMQQAFSSFIGFPVRHHINVAWEELSVDRVVEGVTKQNAEKCSKSLLDMIPDLKRKENPWHIAVPILNRNKPPKLLKPWYLRDTDPRELYGGQVDYSKKEPPVLGYLKDRGWKNKSKEKGVNPAYPPTAYFATREKIHAPVCSVCPRLPLHMSGDCRVGDNACFHAFRNHFAPNMFSKLREYDEFLKNREDQ